MYELSEHLIGQGIFPKLSPVSEWLHYTDWARARELDATRQRDGWLAMLRPGPLAERLGLGVERLVEAPRGARGARGADADGPHPRGARRPGRRDEIRHGDLRPRRELQSEATVSPAVAGAAMQDGYSGVAIIAPFGCLPGRVIEGVYTPWARARGYPVLALENDGQPYPPNVVSRLEVFAQNVARYERRPGATPADPD